MNEPLSPVGFTQALAQNIGVIEKHLQLPDQAFDANTGGIQAFATKSGPITPRVEGHRCPADTASQTDSVAANGGLQAFATSRVDKRSIEEVSGVEETPKCPAKVGNNELSVDPSLELYQQVIPEDLIEDRPIIFDVMNQQAFAIKTSPGQTIGDLIKAHQDLQGGTVYICDILGRVCPADHEISNQVYIMDFQRRVHLDLETRAQSLVNFPRWQSLLLQGGAVAVDEMNQYLQIVAKETKCGFTPPLVIDTLHDCDQFARHWQTVMSHKVGQIVTAICHHHHWIPFVLEQIGNRIRVITTAEGKKLWPILGGDVTDEVHDRISPTSQFDDDCGFQCIPWLITCVAGQPVTSITHEYAIKLRNLVWRTWYATGYPSEIPSPLVLGGHSELETAMCAILKEHGVFMDRVQERSKLVIQKLGQHAITGALKSNRPWQSLKQLANLQSPPIRLIQDDEFQQVLKDRTKDGKAVTTTKKQNSFKKPRTDPVVFTPKDIHIPDGVFAQNDGEVLGQIGVRQVHPNAKGIVLLQEFEWTPFRGQKTISQEGLGFLVMAPYSHEVAQLGQEIRFPAQSVNTGEPILWSAVLIQHGSKEVGRCQPNHPQSIEEIETQTIKILLYRDQCPLDWKEGVPKPVKAVLSMIECLQTCDRPSCQCNKSHKESSEAEPIIDLWQRDFVSLHFQKTKPDQAAIFTCFMRIAKSKLPIVISQSGQEGIYIEPRQQNGKKLDDSYHTVWLNKQTVDEARALQATAKMPVSLVRVTNRYGLRAESRFGPELHRTLKPDSPFIANGEKTHFVVGPLPFGTTKKAMQKLFEQWGWIAQPIHPCGRSQDQKGLMWKVVSGCSPQHLVYTLAHGDVMVTRETIPDTKEAAVPQVEASRHTLTKQHQGADCSKEWDPWAAAASKLPAASSARVQELTPAQIASVEAKIESNLLSKMSNVNDTTMDTTEPRIAALEAQFLELKQSQQQCVDQQQQVNVKMDALQHQVECQATTFQSCLEQQMAEQMKRIESLLNKRKATE